jgi:hypothetical protein
VGVEEGAESVVLLEASVDHTLASVESVRRIPDGERSEMDSRNFPARGEMEFQDRAPFYAYLRNIPETREDAASSEELKPAPPLSDLVLEMEKASNLPEEVLAYQRDGFDDVSTSCAYCQRLLAGTTW